MMKVLSVVSIVGFALMAIVSIMYGLRIGAVVASYGCGLATGVAIWSFVGDEE